MAATNIALTRRREPPASGGIPVIAARYRAPGGAGMPCAARNAGSVGEDAGGALVTVPGELLDRTARALPGDC